MGVRIRSGQADYKARVRLQGAAGDRVMGRSFVCSEFRTGRQVDLADQEVRITPERRDGGVEEDGGARLDSPSLDTGAHSSLVRCARWRASWDLFARTYRRQHPKAVERLERDWERMIASYAFPQEHWRHLRTTNIIESPFAAVRLRTSAAKRFKKVENATALIWKTLLVVEQHFRKLNAPHLGHAVHDGTVYRDGQRVITVTRKLRAA